MNVFAIGTKPNRRPKALTLDSFQCGEIKELGRGLSYMCSQRLHPALGQCHDEDRKTLVSECGFEFARGGKPYVAFGFLRPKRKAFCSPIDLKEHWTDCFF